MDQRFEPSGGTPPKSSSGNTAVKVVAIGCGVLLLLGALGGGLATWYMAKKAKDFAANPAYASLRLAVMANKDLETVESDANAGTITVKDKRTGKTNTLTIGSMRDGKLVVAGDGGEVVLQGGPGGGEMIVHGKNGEAVVAHGGAEGGSLVVTGPDGGTQALVVAEGGKLQGDSPQGQVVVQQGDNKVEVKGPEGTVQMGSGEGAPQVPAWLPLYPGATRTADGALVSDSESERTGTFALESTDPPGKVLDGWEAQLKGAGLPVRSKIKMDTGGMLMAGTDGGPRTVTLTVSAQDGKTTIGLTFVEKKSK